MAVTNEVFDPHEYLSKGGFGKTILQVKKNEGIFSQGEPGDTVFYIQKGKVKLTVVSPAGKEAPLASPAQAPLSGRSALLLTSRFVSALREHLLLACCSAFAGRRWCAL